MRLNQWLLLIDSYQPKSNNRFACGTRRDPLPLFLPSSCQPAHPPANKIPQFGSGLGVKNLLFRYSRYKHNLQMAAAYLEVSQRSRVFMAEGFYLW